MAEYKIEKFPKTRIATNDVCAVGLQKHHVHALIEVDVSGSREKIKEHKKRSESISFTAWLIKVISATIKEYEHAAAYLKGKRSIVIFNDINVSLLIEKEIEGVKVPIPLLIKKCNEKSIAQIMDEINDARNKKLTKEDIVLHNKPKRMELFYYSLPGFIRRDFWRYLIKHPLTAFDKMGNVSISSIGMMGRANGWFVPISVHPICFGIGRIAKKPVVINDKIEIREIINMTVLMDHDVIDGAQMARFISKLSGNIENGVGL